MAIDPRKFANQSPEERRAYLQKRFTSLNVGGKKSAPSTPPAPTKSVTGPPLPVSNSIQPPTQSQIFQTPGGASGRLSEADMAAFVTLPAEAQAAFLQSRAVAPPNAPPVPNTPAPAPLGGFTYGEDREKSKALVANTQLWASDPEARQVEIERTLDVIRGLEAAGEDASAQRKHLTQTLNYEGEISTAANQPPSPGSLATGVVGAPVSFQPMSPGDIQKQAEAAVAKKLEAARLAADQSIRTAETNAGQFTQTIQTQLAEALQRLQAGATQAQEGVQTEFDRANEVERDNRTLQDFAFKNKNNPFSGRTDYSRGLIGREREITDRQQEADLATRIGNINEALASQTGAVTQSAQNQLMKISQDLADTRASINEKYAQLASAAPEDIDALVRSIQQDERQYALDLQKFELDQSKVTGSFIDPTKLALKQEMDRNSDAWKSASAAEKKRLHERNLEIAEQLGMTYDPGTGAYTEPDLTSRTIEGQNADLNNAQTIALLTGFLPDGTPTNAYQQQQLGNAWDVIDKLGYVPANLADAVGVPAFTRTADAIQQAKQTAIQQQNANTSQTNAGTAATKAEQDRLMDIWKATGFAPAGIKDVVEGTPYGGQSEPKTREPANLSSITNTIDKSPTFMGKGIDAQGNVIDVVVDPEGLEAYILGERQRLGLTDEETKLLYRYYNLEIPK